MKQANTAAHDMKQAETKWTPGPWRAYRTREGLWHVRDSEDHLVACNLTEPMARLIAQSPAMYEAIEKLVGYYGEDSNGPLTEAHQLLAAGDGRGK